MTIIVTKVEIAESSSQFIGISRDGLGAWLLIPGNPSGSSLGVRDSHLGFIDKDGGLLPGVIRNQAACQEPSEQLWIPRDGEFNTHGRHTFGAADLAEHRVGAWERPELLDTHR